MNKEIQTFTQIRPTWEAAGEWVVAESQSSSKIDIPAFVIWAEEAYTDLAQKGVGQELPPALIDWIKTEMTDTRTERSKVHPVFSGVFPVPSLPTKVIPEWKPFREIQTFDPARVIVVQPLILTPVAVPRVMTERLVEAKTYVPPRTDPFVMAAVSRFDRNPILPRAEAGHLRMVISSFWNNLVAAGIKNDEASKILALKATTTRQAAEQTQMVMSEASVALTDLAKKISFYLQSGESKESDFPLSRISRGVIQLPWLIKAAEAWMNPIKMLAASGRIELPES